MHDDDLDLATRFAAVDVTPRPRWMAELRADLEAGWDTGELPQDIGTPARPELPWRWPERRTWVFIAAAVAVTIALVFVVTDGVSHTVTPTDEPTTDLDSTVRATLAPAPAVVPSTPPTASAGSSDLCHPVGLTGPLAASANVQTPGGGEFLTYTSTAFWTVTPISCTEAGRTADSFDVASAPFDSSVPGTTMHVDFAAIEAAAPGVTLGPTTGFPGAWGNLALVGVTDAAVFMRTDAAVIRIDLADAGISAIDFPFAEPALETMYMTAVCVVDDFAVVGRFSDLLRADFTTGSLRPWATDVPTACPITSQPSGGSITPPVPANLTYLDQATQLVTRLAADGTKTTTPKVSRQLFIVHPGRSTLWALTVEEGQPLNPMDPATPAHLSRIDPITGEVLVTLDPNPPDSFCPGSYRAYVNDDGILAVCSAEHLWWVTNDGLSTTLAPLPGEPIGLEGNLVLLRTAEVGLTTVDLRQYLPSTP